MTAQQREQLLSTLQARFEKHRSRHADLDFADVRKTLLDSSSALRALLAMEESGGEPDVIGYDSTSGLYAFCDCSAETPAGRRSLCYDREALASRKEHKPANSAVDMAREMGIELLSEPEYHRLQELGDFDTSTSSWLLTPANIRERGGAIFGDKRYGRTFVYHNGAQSYYASRGFRGVLRV